MSILAIGAGRSLPLTLCLAGLTCWGLALLASFLASRHSCGPGWSIVIGTGSLLLLAGAIAALLQPAISCSLRLPFWLGLAPAAIRLDSLAAFFLLVIAIASAPVALYLPGYLDHLRRHVDMRLFWAGIAVLLGSMSLVVIAQNAITFLVAWELMSLSSFLLVATDHRPRATRRAALIYLGATRIGTGLLAVGFLWAHALTGSWQFQHWALHGAAAIGPGLLILAGLSVKAGIWPFHLWLPIAHPAAPAPVSALMSGLMVKVAIYAILRLFVLNPAFAHPAFGYIMIVLGAISAFWGILFALLQEDLKRLLAYSTVENIGLILIGAGGAVVAAHLHQTITLTNIAALCLSAALFHVLNHALFKTLLFLGAGAVDISAHGRDFRRLGGLGQRMPWTFALFTLGSAAICGLPPLNGFASEWLLYQGALRFSWSPTLPLVRFAGLIMAGWLALVGALALSCFLKTVGITFQGRPRSPEADRAREVPACMVAAQAVLGAGCLLTGLLAPVVLRAFQSLIGTTGIDAAGVKASALWTVPMSGLLLILVLSMLALFLLTAPREREPRRGITWCCGFGDLTPRMQAAGFSFVQPIARMFGALFCYDIQKRVEGGSGRLFPEEIRAEARTEQLLETRLYSPLARWVHRAGGSLARLQAGSIHLYLLTMFITLLVLLAIGGRR